MLIGQLRLIRALQLPLVYVLKIFPGLSAINLFIEQQLKLTWYKSSGYALGSIYYRTQLCPYYAHNKH